MGLALLDTDTLSEVLKQRNPTVAGHGAAYLQAHGQFAFSTFTRFEILRGYRESNATRQLPRFAAFCTRSLVLPVTDANRGERKLNSSVQSHWLLTLLPGLLALVFAPLATAPLP